MGREAGNNMPEYMDVSTIPDSMMKSDGSFSLAAASQQ